MYYKKVNYQSNKECFEFLSNHFVYDTMNSWNGLRSIANNVKVYNLPDVDSGAALKVLEEDEYFNINQVIIDWEEDHPRYKVAFNGRSGGYLVLYNNQNNKHCFDDDFYSPCYYDDYDSWKGDVQECYGSLKAYHDTLVYEVKVVQEFDKLCDDLVKVLKSLIEDMHYREEHTHQWNATLKHEYYWYDTKDDMKYHREYMLQHGAEIFTEDEEGMYIEYKVNKQKQGEVIA